MAIRARQPENGQGVLFAQPVQRLEVEIRAEIEAVLRFRGVCFSRTDATPVRVLVDGRPIFHGRVRRGWPDITAVLPGGRVWGIEVKRSGEKLNPEQERVRAGIEERLQAWTPARPTIRPAAEFGAGLLDEWARIAESGELPPRIDTGLHDLDFLLGGVCPGEMLVVGARPGCGKTAFAVSLAARIAPEKHVLFFEFEMSGPMLLERFYSGLCQLDSRIFRDPTRFTPEDWQAVTAAQQVVADWRLWISDNQQAEVSEICATVADYRRRGQCDVVIIDYLQLVEASGGFENRQVEVSKISRKLKRLAVEQGVVVVALAQLNRDAGGEPELKHLRESGAIEADADQVIFLWQEDDPDGPIQTTKCKVAKNRSGQVGICDLMFFKHMSTFFNADR